MVFEVAVIFLFLLSGFTRGHPIFRPEDPPRSELIEKVSQNERSRLLKSSKGKSSEVDDDFTVVTVFLSQEDLDNTTLRFDEGFSPGNRQGGVFPLYDPRMRDKQIGDYSFLITFLTQSGCIATGAYTFTTQEKHEEGGNDQITFTATCSGLPFFSITGGQGKYDGADGFVQFMIPVDGGFLHKINLSENE